MTGCSLRLFDKVLPMMSLDRVSEHLSTLDGVRRGEQGGLLRWTVKGRLVARQLDADTIVVRSGFDEREALVGQHPETFTVWPRFEAHQMVVVELTSASSGAVRDALDAAWTLQTGHDR